MVTVPKEEPKKEEALKENNSVIMSSAQVKPEEVEVEHEAPAAGETPVVPRKQKADPLEEMRQKMAETEQALKESRERETRTARERDETRTQIDTTRANLAKSETEKVQAQENAIINRVEAAKTAVENAERALEEAIDTGKPAKEQITMQKRLAEAVYAQKGAETAKGHFDNWKEQQKNKPVPKEVVQKTAGEKWIDEHPRFTTDKEFKRAAILAHSEALVDGVTEGSDEYFRRINEAIKQFEGGNSVQPPAKTSAGSGTSTAAPPSHNSTEAGARGGNAAEESRTGRRTFKLDGAMREMALKTYGKNSSHKLSDDEAYKRYAARQLEIRDKRANGERI